MRRTVLIAAALSVLCVAPDLRGEERVDLAAVTRILWEPALRMTGSSGVCPSSAPSTSTLAM